MSEKLSLELRMDITYIPNGISKEDLKANLSQEISNWVGEGGLTRDTPAEVDTYYYEIKEGQ